MVTTERKQNEHGDSTDLDLGFLDLDSCAIDGFSDQDFGSDALDCLGNASGEPSDMDLSHLDSGSQGFDLELTDAESAIIRLVEGKIAGSRGRAAATKSEKIYITHEDFDEGPERDAFLLIFGYAEHLFESPDRTPFNADDIKKLNALKFFFCRNDDALNFKDACEVISNSIRLDVLRLRFMLEFWMRGWKIPALPWNADPLPSRIELMAAQYEGVTGIALAREAWFEPGIDAADLIERVLDDRDESVRNTIKTAFKDLVLNYVLSIQDGKVYTTGKNPILEFEDKLNDPTVKVRGRLANIYWSRKF